MHRGAVKPLSCIAMKRLALLVALLLPLAPARASACSCMAQTVEDAIAASAAIFEGRVASIERRDDGLHVRFDVVQTWRAANAEHVEVITPADSAACGFPFEVGRSYLVYARDAEGALHAGLCSRTRAMEEAGDDRAVLGSGTIPVDVTDDPEREPRPRQELGPRGGGCAGCTVSAGNSSAAAVLAMLLTLGLAMRRRIR